MSESRGSEPQDGDSPVARSGWRTALVGIAAFLAAVLAVGGAQLTSAAWNDDEFVTPTVSAGRLSQVTGVTCVVTGILAPTATIGWQAPGDAPPGYSYIVRVVTPTGTTETPTSQTSVTLSNGLLATGEVRVDVFMVVNNWRSEPQTRYVRIFLGLLSACSTT